MTNLTIIEKLYSVGKDVFKRNAEIFGDGRNDGVKTSRDEVDVSATSVQ